MKTNLTFEEALQQHELDVAGLEINSSSAQLENIKKWMGRVCADEEARAAKAIAVAEYAFRHGKLRRNA